MTALHKNLKLYLEKISDGSISKQQLTEFIHYSRVIVQSYLFQIRTSLTFLYSQQGLSAEDVAWDCLGSLFIKDSTFRYPIFVRFKTSLSTSLETISEVELFSAYKGLLITFADRQLARLFAQFDVDGAKIHRNIRDCIKTTSLFTLSKDIRGLVLKPFAHNSLDHLPAFQPERLESEFLNRVNHIHTIKQLLEELHSVLIEQNEFRRSVTLVEATQLIKKVFAAGNPYEPENDSLPAFDSMTEFDVELISHQVKSALKEKIIFTYFARGKLNRAEAESIFAAFEDIITDWLQNNGSLSLYQYLIHYISIDEQTYNNSYRTKMEYLLKFVKDEFRSRLMDDL